MKETYLLVIFYLSVFSFRLSFASASEEGFIFSEVMYDPSGSDSGREWVEVYNSATLSAEIIGGSVSNSLRFNDGSNHTLAKSAFQGSMTVDPQSYFILAQDVNQFRLIYPNYLGTLIEVSAMSLGNTLDTIALRLGSSGSFFASFTYDKNWGGSGSGKSLEKKLLTGNNDSNNWISSSVDGGSPGVAYQEPPLLVYPTTVKINEFLPDPLTGDEWVELYNDSADNLATVSNWQLDDIEGGSAPQTFSTTISPRGYYLFYFSSSVLNNDGDSLRLIRSDGIISDSIDYSESTKGFSWALSTDGFKETSTPTPGGVNTIAPDPDIFEGGISDIKKLPLNHKISLIALVSVPENLLGDKDIYVWDKDTGIKISYSQNLDQSLNVGDKIKVSSTVEESYNEKYIKTEKLFILQKQVGGVEEVKIKTAEATENNEGRLVEIRGKLEEQSGDTFYLNDGSGKAKVFIKDSTGIVKPKMSVGDEVRVVGVVSQYGYLKNEVPNYRILPRFQSDIYNLDLGKKVEERILGATTGPRELPLTGPSLSGFVHIGWGLVLLGFVIRFRWVIRKT